MNFTVPITEAESHLGAEIIEISAGKLRAWSRYRRITAEGSKDTVRDIFYPNPAGQLLLLDMREISGGVFSILISRDGHAAANRILCSSDATLILKSK